VSIALPPGITLSGTIRDQAGSPMSGLTVRLSYVPATITSATTTGPDGTYALARCPVNRI